jgi:hypothetical protein
MRIELTSPYSRTVTAALKAGTGTSSVTSPIVKGNTTGKTVAVFISEYT